MSAELPYVREEVGKWQNLNGLDLRNFQETQYPCDESSSRFSRTASAERLTA